MSYDRRKFLGTVGTGLLGAGLLSSSASAGANRTVIDGDLDLSRAARHEVVVVFTSNAAAERLRDVAGPDGYRRLDVLPIGYAELSSSDVLTVAGWEETLRIVPNRELDVHNDQAREMTQAGAVQDGDPGGVDAYTGENTEIAVLDTGVNGSHPDLEENLAANYVITPDPLSQDDTDRSVVVDAGPADTDDVGHGTHVIGSIAGTGDASDGQFRGMAPDATVYSYSTNVSLSIVTAVESYDHIIKQRRAGETDVAIVSNSWGSSSGDDYDPFHPNNVATWEAHREGILSVFSAGNSGPGRNTLNDYAKGPHVLCVAATDYDARVTTFSSRGREPDYESDAGVPPEDSPPGTVPPNRGEGANYDRRTAYDNLSNLMDQDDRGGPESDVPGNGDGDQVGPLGLYRNGVGAPGEMVMSTLSPYDPLQAYPVLQREPDQEEGRIWYGRLSGTSMSCPVTSGVASLVVDAYVDVEGELPDGTDIVGVLNNLEHAAVDQDAFGLEDGTQDYEGSDLREDPDEYTPANMGTGFVQAVDAVAWAEDGILKEFAGAGQLVSSSGSPSEASVPASTASNTSP